MTLFAVLPLKHAFSAPQVPTHTLHDHPPPNCPSQPPSMNTDPPLPATNRDAPIPPVTPPRGFNPLSSSHGTPQNRGSGSRTHYDEPSETGKPIQYVRADYDNYIREDLSHHRVYISFENGLHNLLHVPENKAASEYLNIIASIKKDAKYKKLRAAYFKACDLKGSGESRLYEPQVELYNHIISLINKFCWSGHKSKDALLHFQSNNLNCSSQGIFQKLIPDITGKLGSLGDRGPLVWPMIIHVEEMKDSGVALDTGHDSPRAMKHDEEDPVSEHHKITQNPTGFATSSKRGGNTKRAKSNKHKAPPKSQTPNPIAQSNAESTASPVDSQAAQGARVQCARYLMEMLELSVLRSHAFLTLVDRDRLQLMYADRSAIITTSIIDLRSSPGEANFLKMLIAFHRLTPEQWGFLPLVQHSFTSTPSGETAYHRREDSATTNKAECLRGLNFCLNQRQRVDPPIYLTLEDILYHQPGIIGRGTCVVGASCQNPEEWKGQELVVKVSWPSKSRKSEIQLLELARKKAEEPIEGKKAQQTDLHSESQKLRDEGNANDAAKISTAAEEPVKESDNRWVLNHLPNILHSEDFSLEIRSMPMPQTQLASFFAKAKYTNDEFNFCYESRVLRVSIQERLRQLRTLESERDYAQTSYDVIWCHKWLLDYPKILHRDISLSNIMYRLIDGKVYGVLNDFDLSSLLEDVEQGNATSSQRTGTPPYMAMDLLESNSRHLYRHDLESLFYVVLLLCSRNTLVTESKPPLKRLDKPQFNDWFDATSRWRDLATRKAAFFANTINLDSYLDPSFKSFKPWLMILLLAFQDGLVARTTWAKDRARYQYKLDQAACPLGAEEMAHVAYINQAIGFEDNHPKANKPPPQEFDEETLGGHVTFKDLIAQLSIFQSKKLEYRGNDQY